MLKVNLQDLIIKTRLKERKVMGMFDPFLTQLSKIMELPTKKGKELNNVLISFI